MGKINFYGKELIRRNIGTIYITNLLKKQTCKKRLKKVLNKRTDIFEKYLTINI
jgi:hypothetical protein